MKESSREDISWHLQTILIVVLLISNFFPFYITIIVFAVIFSILTATKMFSPTNGKKEIYPGIWIFIAYSFLVSVIFQNLFGMMISIGFIFVVIFFNYYQQAIRPYFIEELLNITLIASFFVFIFALLEHFNLVLEWDYTFLSETMGKTHADRVEGTFFNPNYYALMLEFFIMIGLYKIVRSKTKTKQITYGFITICNIIAIYYTGNRTSYAVLIVALFIFIYIIGYKKIAIATVVILGLIGIIAAISGLMPRMDNLLWAFEDRFYIWETSWKAFKDNMWFGQGPNTYAMIYAEYGGKYTMHAHNIVLDTLLNYGIIGTTLLSIPLGRYLLTLNKMRKYPKLRLRLALITSIITVVFVHGMTDVPIFWIQTGLLFLYVTLPAENMLLEAEQNEVETFRINDQSQ